MPLHQDIAGGHGERQARLKIRPAPMHSLLTMADERQHREPRLHQHAVLPFAPRTQFEIARIALHGMEAGIAQDDQALLKLSHEPLKRILRNIGGVTGPRHHQALLLQQQTEFAADNPPLVGEAFPANLLGAAAFTEGMEQLDPIGGDDAEHRRRGQEDLGPVLMGLQETKEPRPLGEPREQRPIGARQPAIEGPIPDTLERLQQS